VTYPPIGISLAQGLAVVGTSVAILVSAFLAVLILWFVYSNYGVHVAPSPAAMVLLLSLPPVHSFLDLQFLSSGRTVPFAEALAVGAGLIVFRAALESFWVGIMLEWFAGNRSWRTSFSPALKRARGGFLAVLGVEAVFVALTILAVFLGSGALGPALGQLVVIGALIGGLYFLIFGLVIAVAEREGLSATLRLSIKAARVPGPRHMLLAFGYLALTLLLSALTPGSSVSVATPSVLTWAFTLFISFLNLAFLATFTYRWLVVRESVISAPVPPRRALFARRP